MWFIGKILLGFVLFFYIILVWFSTFYITFQQVCPETRGIQALRAAEFGLREFDIEQCQKYSLFQVYRQDQMSFMQFIKTSFIMQKRTIDVLQAAAAEGKIHISFIEEHFNYQGL